MRPDRRRLLLFRHLYSFLQWFPGVVCLAGHDGKLLFANERLRERLGDPRADGLESILPAGPWSEGGRALSGDEVSNIPREWTRTLDGRACRMRIFPYREEDGSPVLLVLGVEAGGPDDRDAALRETCAAVERQVGERTAHASPDLTEMRSRLSALEARILDLREGRIASLESRDRHFDLFESAPVGCVDLDEKGRILRLNRAAIAMAGLEGKRFPGVHFVFFVAPADKDRFYAHLRRVLAEGVRVSTELTLAGRGREPVRVEMVSVPLREGRGADSVIRSVITGIAPPVKAGEVRPEGPGIARRPCEILDRLVENAPIAVAVVQGRELRHVLVNPVYQTIAGPGVTLIGVPFADIFSEAAKRGAADLVRNVLETGRPSRIREFETPIPGRAQSWWEAELLPLRNDAGAVDSVLIIAWETTDDVLSRRRLEAVMEALRRSNERLEERVRERTAALEEAYEELRDREAALSSFYDSAPLMMGIVEPDGDDVVCISGNDATARFFGAPRGAGAPDPAASLWLDRYREAERTGYPVQFEYLHDAGTEPRWLSATVARIGAGPEGRTRFCFVAEDVTDRKRAEAALKESEERFRTLVEHSLVGFFIVQRGRVVFMNPEQEKIFGPLPEGFPVAAFSRNIHPDDRETFRDWCGAVLSGDLPGDREGGIRFHARGRWGSGRSLRWIHARTTPIRYRGEQAVLVNTVDITRFKELERAALVQEKMASLGHVAAGVAHEIRNPLSGLNLYLSSAERLAAEAEGTSDDVRENLRIIFSRMKGASGKIESIVRSVMGFARPEPLRLESVDVAVAIREAVQLVGVAVRRGGVRLDVAPCDGLPRCRADLHLLEQVLVNLIANAAQAMEGQEGERRIVFECAEENGHVLIRVADSGPGVPEELREKIFDPLFTTRSGGTGIGLSFSRKVVADHGGSITVGASRWGGAEFRIRIPADGAPEASPVP